MWQEVRWRVGDQNWDGCKLLQISLRHLEENQDRFYKWQLRNVSW